MWKTSRKLYKLASAGGFVVLILVSLGVVNGVFAQSQSAPPCCVDRWDPNWTERGMWGPGMMGRGHRQRMARHWTFMHGGIPPEYRGVLNPLVPTVSVVEEGGALYQQQCAVCHGTQGMGDGEAARDLNPSPALLAYMIQMPMSVDEYLMWSIAEGGKEFGTAMPGFKKTLSEEGIWKIITFMRAGFPPVAQK